MDGVEIRKRIEGSIYKALEMCSVQKGTDMASLPFKGRDILGFVSTVGQPFSLKKHSIFE